MLNLLEIFTFRDPGNVFKALSLFPPSGRRDSVLIDPEKVARTMLDHLAKPRNLFTEDAYWR